ncbi:MAG: hypothetical protein CMM56_04475, partial [Rhodospirillaceae bacterium]|nr:hypothetical protein [Rhodospirillaceae bacterium]
MINLPDFTPLKTTQVAGHTTRKTLDSLDHALIIIPKNPPELLFKHLPQGQQIKRILQKKSRAGEEIAHLRINNAKATTITISFNTAGTTYNQLCWARNLIAACNHENPSNLGLLVLGLNELDRIKVVSALTVAAEAEAFKLPVFKTKTKTKTRLKHLRILSSESRISLDSIQAQSLGNNIARWFTALPPNILDARKYFDLIDELCGQYSIEHSILNESTLKKLGANAFLAVSQGNAARDAGIIKLKYRPNGEEPADLMLIGKGILFDTGGNNLKPFKSMLDMHMDMGGSAVALGTLIALASLKVPYSIDAWLAVTENRISATAYKSQDIIKSANGTTIQVIHTDAEGRMVLADTLALAARENPKIIIDYATLTGTCVSALTERYSGIFS